MRFKVNFSNHPDPIPLEDYRLLLRLLVESAGHQADIEGQPSTGSCHIFLEGFTPPFVDVLRDIKQGGSESIIVATEYVTGETFNDFPEEADNRPAGKDLRPYWQSRFQTFIACAQHARAIWCASGDPRQVRLYQAVVGQVPVVPLPFPHFDAFPRVTHRPDKDIPIFFSGTLTPYRLRVMVGLAERYGGSFTDVRVRDPARGDFIARSRICLNLKLSPHWQYPSRMRYWYHLSNGSCLLGQQCPISCELDPYVPSVDTVEHLGEACGQLLQSGQWQRLAAEAHQRFAAERPGQPAAEQLLDRSFSR